MTIIEINILFELFIHIEYSFHRMFSMAIAHPYIYMGVIHHAMQHINGSAHTHIFQDIVVYSKIQN